MSRADEVCYVGIGGRPSPLPFIHHVPHDPSVIHTKTPPRLSLTVSSNINHTEILAYFRETIKRRLQRGVDDQAANQWTRLIPNSTLYHKWQSIQHYTEICLDGKSDTPLPGGGAHVSACV